MTNLNVSYWTMVENRRHNKEQEALTDKQIKAGLQAANISAAATRYAASTSAAAARYGANLGYQSSVYSTKVNRTNVKDTNKTTQRGQNIGLLGNTFNTMLGVASLLSPGGKATKAGKVIKSVTSPKVVKTLKVKSAKVLTKTKK